MDELDDVMARLQAMADDVPMSDPVPPQQAGTPLIELPYFIAVAAAAPRETPLGQHRYLSTACIHAQHELCRLTCKYCENTCVCGCHA